MVGNWLRFLGEELKWIREDSFPSAYHLNGAVYMARYEFFLDKMTFLDQDTVPYIMDGQSSIVIDTVEDIKLAEFFVENSN